MTVSTAVSTAVLSVPVDPTVEEARRWVEAELSKAEYADDRGLLERLLDWVGELIDALRGGGGPGLPGWGLPAVLLVIGLLIALVLLVRVRREPMPRGGSRRGGLLDEPHLGADDYRARARRAFVAGDLDGATTDWFRAIAAGAAERAIIDESPGRTAHEVSVALAALFPQEAAALAEAADRFDAVRYGEVPADAAAAQAVAALDERLRTARPFLAATPAAT
jgi:hypothetical protein